MATFKVLRAHNDLMAAKQPQQPHIPRPLLSQTAPTPSVHLKEGLSHEEEGQAKESGEGDADDEDAAADHVLAAQSLSTADPRLGSNRPSPLHPAGATAAESAEAKSHTHSHMTCKRFPAAVLTSAESRDEPPACGLLARLEAEAAAGAMEVLGLYAAEEDGSAAPLRCLQDEDGGEDQEVERARSAGPRQLLGSFCIRLIAAAAADAVSVGGGGAPPRAPLEPWIGALRAVYLAAAIRTYLGLLPPSSAAAAAADGKPGAGVAELWPHMLALVCSPHAAVRHSVADFFCTRVAPLALVPFAMTG